MIWGEKCWLKPLERDTADLLARWRNLPDIHAWFFDWEFVVESEQRAWFESYLADSSRRLWVIYPIKVHDPIGALGLRTINWHNQSAELWNVMVAHPEWQGKGYATDAVKTLVGFAFGEMNLHRIVSRTFADNEAAIKLYSLVGFRMEGIERQAVWKAGEYRDVALMSILREDAH